MQRISQSEDSDEDDEGEDEFYISNFNVISMRL